MKLGAKARIRRLERQRHAGEEPDVEGLTLILAARLVTGVIFARLGLRRFDYESMQQWLADLKSDSGSDLCASAIRQARDMCRRTSPGDVAGLDSVLAVLTSWDTGDAQ